MTGDQFIAYASEIILLHREEAACRTAISRAYYGAFHLAIAFLAELELTIDANHGHVQHDLLQCGHTEGILAGQLLQELASTRIAADYRLDDSDVRSVEFAMLCIATARQLDVELGKLRRIVADPTQRTVLVDHIKSYRTRAKRRV